MKLKTHLEEENLKEAAKPFIKNSIYLTRSVRIPTQENIIKVTTRKDRKPRDIPLYIHNILNDLFYKKFKVKVRSECVFCRKMDEVWRKVVVPIGKYYFYYNNFVSDLYEDANLRPFEKDPPLEIDRTFKYQFCNWIAYYKRNIKTWDDIVIKLLDGQEPEERKAYEKIMSEILNKYFVSNYNKTDNVNDLSKVDPSVEIAIHCDQYYLVDREYYDANIL
jgi:hypothetical protein